MKILLVVVLLAAAGCRSAERRAADDQIECVYDALTKPGLTDIERHEVMHGCHEVWRMRTGRFNQ